MYIYSVSWDWDKWMKFASSRDCPSSLKSSFKVSLLSLVIMCAAIFKGNCRYTTRSPLKQLTRGHYLLIIWSLQASSCSKAFTCATKSITSTFTMRCCRNHSAGTPKSSSWWHKLINSYDFCIEMPLHQKSSKLFEYAKEYFLKISNQPLLEKINRDCIRHITT